MINNKKGNAVITIVVVMLLLILFVGMLGILTKGFKALNPSDWFGDGNKVEKNGEFVISSPDDAGTVDTSTLPDNGYCYDIDGNVFYTGDDKTYVIPANILFAKDNTAVNYSAEAYGANVEWTVEWVDAKKTFAVGRDVLDYVTVTPFGNSSVVKVSCLQPFGAQIKITSKIINTNFVSSYLVDYLSEVVKVGITECYFGVTSSSFTDTEKIVSLLYSEKSSTHLFSPSYARYYNNSVYTIYDNIEYSSFFYLSENIVEFCSEQKVSIFANGLNLRPTIPNGNNPTGMYATLCPSFFKYFFGDDFFDSNKAIKDIDKMKGIFNANLEDEPDFRIEVRGMSKIRKKAIVTNYKAKLQFSA